MSQKYSDSDKDSSARTKPILKVPSVGFGPKLSSRSLSKRNKSDDFQKNKRVLIIKCKTSKENEKAISLCIEGTAAEEPPKSCSISSKEITEIDNADLEKKKSVEKDEKEVVNKTKKKQLKLKFVDELDSANVDGTDVQTPEEKSDTDIKQIFIVEKKKAIYNYTYRPSVEEIVKDETLTISSTNELTTTSTKVDVASAAKEHIMYRRRNKMSLDDIPELNKPIPVSLETTTGDDTMSMISSMPLTSENYMDESWTRTSMGTEEIVTEEVSTVDFLTRDLFTSMYLKTLQDYPRIRKTNDFLHRKMTQYFIKRHMNSALVESENPLENYKKYIRYLNKLNTLMMEDAARREIIDREISVLQENHNQLTETAKSDFADFQQRETEIGTGLIFTKSNKTLAENTVKNLVNTQRKKMEELHQMRVTHIKLRNAIANKNGKLRDLEKLGGNLTRREFDELKTRNRSLMDKIEEREMELTRLRKRNTVATTKLAHFREKICLTEAEMLEIVKKSKKADGELLKVRVNLNKIRTLRDKCRKKTRKMKEDSGLLVKDKLLVDMERCISDVKKMEEELVAANLKFQKMTKKANCLKHNYNKEYAHAVFLSKQLPKSKQSEEDATDKF